MKIERGYFYHDGSCLVNQMHSKGTLLVSSAQDLGGATCFLGSSNYLFQGHVTGTSQCSICFC